jgi:ribose transport system ATP-binding protein
MNLTEGNASSPLLAVRELSKAFPGVQALQNVSLELRAGEVLSVIGENGAGKSTLMKILAGVQLPDSGQVLIDGQPVVFADSRAAIDSGVVLIHQELNLCSNLNASQNIFLGREPRWGPFILSRRMNELSRQYLQAAGLDIAPTTPLGQLTIGKQQMVEIAKALSVKARVIIFDEPTSSLTSKEAESLFGIIRSLKEQGCGIIYISHRLDEVKRISDRVEVLRDGRNAGCLVGSEIVHDNMVRLMVGRDISSLYPRTQHPLGRVVLQVNDVRTPAHPTKPISFAVRAGEIVGLAGLVGAGRTELLQTLFGITPATGGNIEMDGGAVRIASPQDAIQRGLALVPEDRKFHGLIVDMAIRKNVSLPRLKQSATAGLFIDFAQEKDSSRQAIEKLGIKTTSDQKLAKFLSGGNQQKIVIGKWLALSPRLLLLDEPTRGIDVGAKQEIYRLMEQLAAQGMAILFASSEMEEVMGLADRILVMHEGQLRGELDRTAFSEEAIMRLATGQSQKTIQAN